ncbi:hypothetical protein IFM89_030342 [Coptis chinensis]|uniref:Uncharacterized protein n=1 Tax=Coptis chinensis TaxID=261450 RepID=A0A835IEM7_9MAGN|nr:hypothetical protein IFM89_030342 [Coptis chinensis]
MATSVGHKWAQIVLTIGPSIHTHGLPSTYSPSFLLHISNTNSRHLKTLIKLPLTMESAVSSDKVYVDVLAQGRTACYKARDAFYTCIEKQSNKKASEVGYVGLLYPVECKKSRELYVKQCRPTWVKHFDRQHCSKRRVHRLLDNDEARRGPISLPQPYIFKTSFLA